ncbi:uncharacterized protein LAESUDRAFT_130486 [Laetiporus sulphureus 93-53]|uniref:F-box domain-containing protein n=1 Tax=Laetiporus sulphureus 93-53 TaxID=1314785 RepID=A0A165EHE7_9APHY|nr:uncharacterized protein LAESUDRAFT_130486 [Laetiporus sulphureus 93-53]KZT07058.1 hypothetical protein LAESUDRAFT_130486 [Laetiporus sulphureus 93-53]
MQKPCMSLQNPQRNDIKRIINALSRQAVELQSQRTLLIRVIQDDPSYVEEILRVPHGVQYLLDSDPARYHHTEAVTNLIHRVQRIEASLARIKEKTTELLLLIPPIASLPEEILALIFQAGSLAEHKSGLPFPMLIASVSRTWRKIALSTSTLWTNVYTPLYRPRHWLPIALERSATQPLDITLDFRTGLAPSSEAVVACMAAVSAHMYRWRRFTLITHHRNVVLLIGELLASAQSLSLQHLRLSLTGSGPAGNQEVSIPRLFAGGAPELHSVRLDSVVLPWRSPPLVGLTMLDIRWLWFRKLMYSQFQDLLAASPNLTTLTLRGKHIDLRPGGSYTPIYLPNLRYLEVSGDKVCLLCALLVPPALETLTLANVDEGEFREFMSWLPYSGARYSALKSLVLLNVATCPLSREFIAAFSTITQLTIINSGAERFLELLRSKQTFDPRMPVTLNWPGLKNVTMLDDTSYDKVYGMVAERAAHCLPLHRLIVHTEFIHRYLMTPLAQFVKIDSVTSLDREP